MDDETLDSLATTTADAPGMHPLLARLLRLPGRVWLRLASPAGLRLLSPLIAAVVVYLLWRLWGLAGRSVLGRMVRWWAGWIVGALLAGVTVFLLISPPETSSDAVALRALAEEELGKPAIYSVPIAVAGGLATFASTIVAAWALWKARVTPEERVQARRDWAATKRRLRQPVRLAALGVVAPAAVACAALVAAGSVIPVQVPPVHAAASTGSAAALWVGTTKGASRLAQGSARWEPVRRPWISLPSSEVTDLAAGPSGEVWIATTGGLLRRRAPGEVSTAGEWFRVTVETAPLPYPTVLGVAIDRRGTAWAATAAGAAGIDVDGSGRAFNNRSAPLLHQLLNAAYVDRQGLVWFGSAGGVNVYEPPAGGDWGASGRWPAGFNRAATEGALPDNVVYTIFGDSKGRVWFGTAGGAAAFTPDRAAFSLGSTERGRWQTFTTGATPLAGREVLAIAEDRQGRIWLGTENGISVLEEVPGSAPRWQQFTAGSGAIAGSSGASGAGASGLPHRRVQALAVDGDGRVWAGTKDGLAAYDPARLQDGWTTYRSHPLRRITGWIFPPHASSDVIADEITALAWVPGRRD